MKCCWKTLDVIKSESKEEELMKLLALTDQTDDGMPFLLVNLTKACMKSDADIIFIISK